HGGFRRKMRRAQSAAYWIAPSLFCLILYWYGLKSWFRADDFAWLGLGREIFHPSDFWRVMFAPMAQGTIRPLSERAYFIGLHALFGLDALPFRILAFATQFANLVLLSWITLKLTGSRVAGFWAPILWTANSALVIAMTWCSTYNQILCGCFLLGSFALFLKYQETGKRRFYWWQLLVFALGFSALEINVMYPALVASYLAFNRRPVRRGVLDLVPLFALSIAFSVMHLIVAPRQTTGPYVLYFDHALPHTLWKYWQWALVPEQWWDVATGSKWLGVAGVVVLTVLLLGFAIREARRGGWLPTIFLSWFVLLLLPILPLKNHVLGYYLTLPALALAMLGATAFARSWRAGKAWRVVGLVSLAAYLFIDVPISWADTRWNYEVARSVKILVLGVAHAHELHPNSTILLADIGNELYDNAIAHSPFRLVDALHVYLTPEAVGRITPHPDSPPVSEYALAPGPTLLGLHREQVVVYVPFGDRLKNVTTNYEEIAGKQLKSEIPRRVDAGNPLFAYLLGPAWYPIDTNYRWMPESASLAIGAPASPSQKLYIHGSCPTELTKAGPLRFTVRADGQVVSVSEIGPSETLFDRTIELPVASVGKESIELKLNVNRTLRRTDDDRNLGLAFGIFDIR
ncbi:MAG: hypothetical protein M3Z23_08310, partial [Acidobacteriota bacterium]|nr:hypothetical protein [Acidobacteriota bacterium]